MFLKEVFLVFIGLSAGGIIAAGVFAFFGNYWRVSKTDRSNPNKEAYSAL